MRIEQLLYITEISKTGSIAKTSERLYVSSPGISLAISNLEEELGVKIFERSRTGLEPTETGKNLIIIAQEILNHIEKFKQKAKNDSLEIEGHLSISAVPGICRSIIAKTSAVFSTKFPKVALDIKDSSPSKVRKDVLSGEVDLGFTFYIEENQMFNTTHIIDSPMMVCFTKGSELANLDNLTIEEITKYPIVFTLDKSETARFRSQVFGQYNEIIPLIQSQNFETKKHFISQGLAIGLESALTTKSNSFYQQEDIVVRPVQDIELKVPYYCIQLKNNLFSNASKEFLKELHIQAAKFKE